MQKKKKRQWTLNKWSTPMSVCGRDIPVFSELLNLYDLQIDWCHNGPNFVLDAPETLNKRRCGINCWQWLCMLTLNILMSSCYSVPMFLGTNIQTSYFNWLMLQLEVDQCLSCFFFFFSHFFLCPMPVSFLNAEHPMSSADVVRQVLITFAK